MPYETSSRKNPPKNPKRKKKYTYDHKSPKPYKFPATFLTKFREDAVFVNKQEVHVKLMCKIRIVEEFVPVQIPSLLNVLS